MQEATQNNLTLETIATIKQGFNISRYNLQNDNKLKPANNFTEEDYFRATTNSGYKYIVRMPNIDYGIVLHNIQPSLINDKYLEYSKLEQGDILLSIRGQKIKSAMVDFNEHRSLYACSDLCIIRPKLKIYSYYIWSLFYQPNVAELLKTPSNKVIVVNDIKNIPIAPASKIYDESWLKTINLDYRWMFTKITLAHTEIETTKNLLAKKVLQNLEN